MGCLLCHCQKYKLNSIGYIPATKFKVNVKRMFHYMKSLIITIFNLFSILWKTKWGFWVNLAVCPPPRLKARIVEPGETAVANQRFGKHIPVVMNYVKRAMPVTGSEGSQGWETSRLPLFLDNRLTDGGEVVSLTRWPPFTPSGRFLILISVRGWVDPRVVVQLEGLSQLRNPVASWGIEPTTFWLVA
jgi:hypothetical protein